MHLSIFPGLLLYFVMGFDYFGTEMGKGIVVCSCEGARDGNWVPDRC